MAQAHEYRDCLAAAHQVLGDLERLAPQPDAARILQHYTGALAYAADFNRLTLARMLDYQRAIWSAHAEDDYADQALWFCRSVVALWRETGMAEEYPEVIETFEGLAASMVAVFRGSRELGRCAPRHPSDGRDQPGCSVAQTGAVGRG
jgi:hypothetical protein